MERNAPKYTGHCPNDGRRRDDGRRSDDRITNDNARCVACLGTLWYIDSTDRDLICATISPWLYKSRAGA